MNVPRIDLLSLSGAAFVLLFAAVPALLRKPFYDHVAILIVINSLVAISIHLMLRINQLSLAQAGFMGIGAYASALLTRDAGLPFAAAFLLAGLIPGLLAGAAGPVLLRIRGVQFVLLSFALSETIAQVFVEWVSLFGGNNGLSAIPPASVFGLVLNTRPAFLAFSTAVLVVVILLCRQLLRGDIGVIIEGLSGNEALLSSLGVDPLPYRCLLFAVSASIAGFAGSLYAHYLGFISPEAFGFWASVNALIMNVLGGVSYLIGPLLGAVVLVPLPEMFRDSAQYQRVLYGIALLLLMRFLPQGLIGVLRQARAGWVLR